MGEGLMITLNVKSSKEQYSCFPLDGWIFKIIITIQKGLQDDGDILFSLSNEKEDPFWALLLLRGKFPENKTKTLLKEQSLVISSVMTALQPYQNN